MVVLVVDVLSAAIIAGSVLIPAACCGAFYSCRLLRCLCLCLPVFAAWRTAVIADLKAAAEGRCRRRNRRGADGAAAFLRVARRALPVHEGACSSGECECQEICDITWMVKDVIMCLLDVAKSGWARDGDAELLCAWTRAVVEAAASMRAFDQVLGYKRLYWGDYETVFERLRERAAPGTLKPASGLEEAPLLEEAAPQVLTALEALEAWRAESVRAGRADAGRRYR